MDLILWRHAEAEEGAPDMERRLTTRGQKHAARVAAWLLQRLPSRITILASPARRTVETAQALNTEFKTSPRLAPGASVADVIEAARWPDRKGMVLVVGHQPTLGEVAAYLTSGRQTEWSIRKGGLWWLTHRERGSTDQVVVRAVIGPDLL